LDKKVLSDYVDICELISEMEEEIRNLRKKETVHDKVIGSNPEFPYEQRSFHVAGMRESYLDDARLKKELDMLEERKYQAEKMKAKIDKWMKSIPARMQRIVRMKYFERKTWGQISERMGENVTENSIKKEFERFMKIN
jgi:DNA-directed RNA polymerase specialized sigma24 family protein